MASSFQRLLHRGLLVALFAGTLAGRAQASDSLISQDTFNNSDRVQLVNGAIIGPAGSGVSGHLDDKALESAAAGQPPSPEGPYAALTAKPERPVQNLGELTVTGWYKPRQPMQQDSTPFVAFATSLLWEAEAKRWVWRVDARSDTEPRMMHWFFSDSKPEWAVPGEWVFFAMVWKREGGQAQFYRGGRKEVATPDRAMTRNEQVLPLSEREGAKNAFGGNPQHPDRAFDGSLDNLRFFSRALTAEGIESIRTSDIGNRKIPAL